MYSFDHISVVYAAKPSFLIFLTILVLCSKMADKTDASALHTQIYRPHLGK